MSQASSAEVASVAARTQVRFRRGQPIPFRIGTRSGFFCIQSGYVKLSYDYARVRRPVRICGPGDLVGYGHWYGDHRDHAEALTTTCACFFDKEQFLAAEDGEQRAELIRWLCRVVLQNSQRIAFLQARSVRSRVAAVLTSLERKFGEPSVQGSRIPVHIDRKTLADLSGTVVETLARVLTEFEENGWIVREGRTIHITKKDLLNDLAHEV